MHRRSPLLISFVFGVSALAPVAASAQVDNPVVAICANTVGAVPEAGPRACKSLDSAQVIAGDACTTVGIPPDVCTELTMQPVVDEALVRQHEASWLARAHALQRRLDDQQPLLNTLTIHTHNSNNATAYDATVTAADPNQIYSITDQLRLESRGIELDLHWVPSPHGSPETGGRAVVLCHGTSQGVGGFTVHVGCSNDRPFATGLVELRAWIDEHPGEFVLLYLENQLEDDPQAHDLAAAAIEQHLAGLVHRPATECAQPDWQLTQQELLDAGTPVLIVGNCGAGGDWGSWVHERGDLWHEGSNSDGYPSWPACTERRADPDYDANYIRTWEDSTWVSAMVGGGSTITPAEAQGMVDCGLDLVGLDRLVPFDERLEAMVWSWDVDEPSTEPGTCAERQTSGRFRSEDCHQHRHFACHGPAGWFVPDTTGPWFRGAAACRAQGGTFRAPATGWDNRLLGAAGAGAEPVWLNYQSLAGSWEAGGPAAAPNHHRVAATSPATAPGTLPTPGRPDRRGGDSGAGSLTTAMLDGDAAAATLPTTGAGAVLVGGILALGGATWGRRRHQQGTMA